jgi:hypothetical protein
MSILGIVLLIVLVLILLGGVGGSYAPWGYGYGLHHGGIGLVGVLLIILIVLIATGRI